MKITIESVVGGAIYRNEHTIVFEFDEQDKEGLVRMLWTMVEELLPNQKYDRENVEIVVKHGRGYDCKNANCSICKRDCIA